MNEQNDILNELIELSPTLSSIPKVNVFSVPDGYFDHLASHILMQTATASSADSVPEGYFDSLANNILARIKKDDLVENAEISTVLAGIGNKNIFTVPAGYFDKLATSIATRLNNETAIDETYSISEIVAGIGNKNVYSVPAGYFEQLADNIVKQTNTTPAKVISIGNTRSRILKYAAAAVVTGIIAMSAVFIFNKTENTSLSAENLAALETAETIIKTNSFDKEVASLDDADIVTFLESKGQDVDAALVASLTEDDKTLPEADDYLFNENTLNEVLTKLDLNN